MASVPAMWRSASCEVGFLPLPLQLNPVFLVQDFALMNTAPPDDVERSRMVKAGASNNDTTHFPVNDTIRRFAVPCCARSSRVRGLTWTARLRGHATSVATLVKIV